MNIYTIITCIGSLILTLSRPVASAGNWAFDPASCGPHLYFLRPQMLRSTTIGKNAATWLPRIPRMESSKPKFAEALLGSDYVKYARAVFNGGNIPWTNRRTSVRGIASLRAETGWQGSQIADNLVCTPCNVKEDHSIGFASSSSQNTDSSQSSYTVMLDIWHKRGWGNQ